MIVGVVAPNIRRDCSLVRPISIALVSSSYSPYVGGVEEHVSQVAKRLMERGYAVEVWTVDRGERLGTQLLHGVRVRYLSTPLPARSLGAVSRFILQFPSAWASWAAACRDFRPDLLHVHCFGPNGLYGLAIHQRFAVPMIITSHGETVADDHGAFTRSALLRWGLTRGCRSSAAVTAPSEFVLSELRGSFGLAGGRVVPNGVDLSVFPKRRSARSQLSGNYLLGVGRLGWMKGFDLLIDAFSRAKIPSDTRLVIIGDGPERDRLGAQVERLGLSGSVAFDGRQSPEGVATAMSGATAVVVPSRMEAFGIVALEAWRAGTTLVMTDRGGASEFVTHDEDGLLIDPEDTTAFARTLEDVVADESRRARLAAAGARRVPEFTWDRVVNEYESVYRSTTRLPADR